jgi:N-acyl-D-amino-acid deacylase
MAKKTSALIFFFFISAAFIVLDGCFQASPEAKFDIVIRGGWIYDGTSAKPRIMDIGIKGDKIAAIGDFRGEAAKTINAGGLIVTPGFIDVHSHTDLFLKEKGIGRIIAYIKTSINGNHNYLYQGVTTMITGNSGKGFPDTAKWLGWVDSLKFGANVYHLAPAGAIRQEMFGAEQKPLNEKQKDIFKKRLIKEMENGAVGVSFDLSENPDRMLTREELIDIATGIKPYGGIISISMRNSSGSTDATGNAALVTSLKEAVEIGRISQAPIEISNLELTAPWKNLNYGQINKVINNARMEGIDITIDQSPYDAAINTLTNFLPAEYVAGNLIKSQYTTAEGKDQILNAIDKLFTSLDPEKFLILSYPANKSYEGKTIRQIAVLESKNPSLIYWEMTIAKQPPVVAVADASERFAKRIMPSQLVFTASEGVTYLQGKALPHPSYWGAFPRKLRKYALLEKIVHLNDAIRSMTSLPAKKFKLRGRGQIAVGNFADIAIINLKKIKDKATFLQPQQYAAGVEYLLVNGIVCLEKGKVNGKKGGRALKRI